MKLWDKITLYVGGLLSGGDVILNNKTDDIPTTITVVQQKELGSKLMQALKKHEVTQEVAELRWRMYMLDREMDNYRVIIDPSTGELKSVRKDPEITKPRVFEEKNKKVVIVQNTESIQSGINNGFTDGMKLHELHKIESIYPLKFERGDISRFPFEKSCYQIVLKQNGKKRIKYYLDFYFYSIPDPHERIKRQTTLELQKVFDKKLSVDYIDDWNKVLFTTNKCWGVDSAISYKLECKKFVGIQKWEMFYVVQYEVKIIEKVDDIEKYFEHTIQKEYDNKTPRPDRYINHSITGNDDMNKNQNCDKCGKLMKFETLESADYHITKDVFGIGMCKDCLVKYMEEKNIIC